jgi:hypothetical protein
MTIQSAVNKSTFISQLNCSKVDVAAVVVAVVVVVLG